MTRITTAVTAALGLDRSPGIRRLSQAEIALGAIGALMALFLLRTIAFRNAGKRRQHTRLRPKWRDDDRPSLRR